MNVDMEAVWKHITGDDLAVHETYTKVCCPFHNDRTPSASIRETRFHCFVCDISENPIGLLGFHLKISYKDACEFARQHAAEFGTEGPPQRGNGGLLRTGVPRAGTDSIPQGAGLHRGNASWKPSWKSV